MSNTCFNCNTKIEDDSYGLTQCPSCHTPIFIDFEGHVQKPPEETVASEQEVSDDLDKPQESSGLSHAEFDSQADSHLENQDETDGESEVLKDPPENASFQEALSSDLFSDQQNSQSDFDIPQDNFDTPSQESMNKSEENTVESLRSNDDIPHDDFSTEKANDKDLQDVIDYANSSDNLDLGGFYYNVVVSGIDSRTLRQSVLDALDDSRFGWKKEEMDALIKDGQLTIEKINAAKTYILISYLKFLPIKVKWDQISITKS